MARPAKLSKAELQVINDNYSRPIEEIAEILERPVESISAFVDEVRQAKEKEVAANIKMPTVGDLMSKATHHSTRTGKDTIVGAISNEAASHLASSIQYPTKQVDTRHIHTIKK